MHANIPSRGITPLVTNSSAAAQMPKQTRSGVRLHNVQTATGSIRHAVQTINMQQITIWPFLQQDVLT